MISFPRLQIRLLQCEEESDKKFDLFPQEDTDVLIYRSKADEAVARAYMCGMVLSSYDDKDVLQDIVHVIETAVTEDGEDEKCNEIMVLKNWQLLLRGIDESKIKQREKWRLSSV